MKATYKFTKDGVDVEVVFDGEAEEVLQAVESFGNDDGEDGDGSCPFCDELVEEDGEPTYFSQAHRGEIPISGMENTHLKNALAKKIYSVSGRGEVLFDKLAWDVETFNLMREMIKRIDDGSIQ